MPPPHIVKAGCQPLTTIIIEVGIVLRIGRRESTRPPPPKKKLPLKSTPLKFVVFGRNSVVFKGKYRLTYETESS